MDTKFQFQKNAKVSTADGRQLGMLERVVLNPENNLVTHIVVQREGLLHNEDKVVPIEMVAETGPDRVLLNREIKDLESLPPFEEKHLVNSEAGLDDATTPINTQAPMYGYSQLGTTMGPVSQGRYTTDVDQNIPDGSVALKEGAQVVTVDGKHIGKVERIVADEAGEHATHLLVTTGLIARERKLVPMDWIRSIFEDEVYLEVDEAAIRSLEDAHVTD
jgi:uncharacterized protein YrrD